jgi:hypothetical protein
MNDAGSPTLSVVGAPAAAADATKILDSVKTSAGPDTSPAALRALSVDELQALRGATLRPYARRKVNEELNRREAEELKRKREERAARKAAKASAPVDSAPTSSPTQLVAPAPSTITPEQRTEAVTRWLQGLFRVLHFIAGFLGYEVTPLADADARNDARAWLPLVERYAWADSVVTFSAGPLSLIERVAAHLKRREAPPAGSQPTDVIDVDGRRVA